MLPNSSKAVRARALGLLLTGDIDLNRDRAVFANHAYRFINMRPGPEAAYLPGLFGGKLKAQGADPITGKDEGEFHAAFFNANCISSIAVCLLKYVLRRKPVAWPACIASRCCILLSTIWHGMALPPCNQAISMLIISLPRAIRIVTPDTTNPCPGPAVQSHAPCSSTHH